MSETSHRHYGVLLIAVALATFVLIKMAPTRIYVSGDSQESLVTAQSILQNKTIRLDAYYLDDKPNTVVEEKGHLYYYFPLGTSLLSLPFVGVQLLRGKDMLVEADNFALQKTLAALALSLCIVLIYWICRHFVDYKLSWLFTIIFVFGSSIASTAGSALWSIDFALIFMLLAVLILVHEARSVSGRLAPYLLGCALFMAYLCRPSTLTMVLPIFAYVLWVKRAWLLRMAAPFVFLTAILMLFSQNEFGQLLPSYYLASRLRDNDAFWTAVYGNLASPGRGLFIYSPFLIAVLIGLFLVFKHIRRQPLFWLAAAWIILHLISISQFWHWWGGWGFGNRLMAETLPAWLLITLLVWPAAQAGLSRPAYASLTAGFVALGVVAIYFNTGQGLFNPATVDWNRWHRPLARDEYPQSALMLDWKYPQFLASPRQLKARNNEYTFADSLKPLALGESIHASSEEIVFGSWNTAEINDGNVWRRSSDNAATIPFRVESLPDTEKLALAVQIAARDTDPQQVRVLLNGQSIGVIATQRDGAAAEQTLTFDSSLLIPSVGRRFNTLELRIVDSVSPAVAEPSAPDHHSGLSLQELRLVAVD